VLAVQDKFIPDEEMLVAVRLVGTDGAIMSTKEAETVVLLLMLIVQVLPIVVAPQPDQEVVYPGELGAAVSVYWVPGVIPDI
jgi:hypothetical protein